MTRFSVLENTVYDMHGEMGPEPILQSDYERLECDMALNAHECRIARWIAFADIWEGWGTDLTHKWNQTQREMA